MKEKMFGVLQRVGRSFMLPIAILPVAGLFLGVGGSFTNATMLEAYGLLDIMGPGTLIYSILTVMSRCGDIVFANLALLFAIGVAIGMAKKEKEVAALSAVIAFFVMHTAIGSLIDITDAASHLHDGAIASVVGIQSLQMGVFGGIIVGLGVAALHNRFYKIELPQVLSFFGGTRFVPIVSAITYLVVGIAMFYIWPVVQEGIYAVGALVTQSGYLGTLIYGLMERLLIPFGLHHVFYIPFWQTALGGTAMVDGVLIEGAQNIFFAELASGNVTEFSVSATRFMSGKFPLMIFGLPGAALAMYHTAKPEKKVLVKGLLISAAVTSMLTGITEPLEFTFLFVAPVLYGIHCVGAGLAYMIMHILEVAVGMTFSGGILDLFLFGMLQGNDKTNWVMVVLVGLVYFVVYYAIFRFVITKLNLKTPGREDEGEETKLYTRKDVDARKNGASAQGASSVDETSLLIVQGLGGKKNISDVDCCATRLRITVKDAALVLEKTLKQSGAAGVLVAGNGVQVIYGPRVSVIKSNLEDFLESDVSDNLPALVECPVQSEAEVTGAQRSTDENTAVAKEIAANALESVTMQSPMVGEMRPLSETPDPLFAQELLGKGVVFFPKTGELFAPCDAKVTLIADTKHAIGLETENGTEILLHVGINTVKLEGVPFHPVVEQGQTVTAGELLMTFDLDIIEQQASSIATPMIFTNLAEERDIKLLSLGDVESATKILTIF
ncbi:MAG: glucose PTS transporter subunit IIA [Faecalibacterium sp.]